MQHPVKKAAGLLFCLLLLLACTKNKFSNNGELALQTSADTLHFDTVFSSAGSVSQLVKIINPHSSALRIGEVRLGGGAASPYRINVDGLPGPSVRNVEVAANDSVYVFVTVTVTPTAATAPFVARDSLAILYNGRTQWVQLEAWGRNARYLRNRKLTTNETWTNELPYVILEGLTVEPNATLTIQEGTRVYINARAPFVVRGSLQVWGDRYDSTRVIFQGDRTDEPYRDFPAGFPGLVFTSSSSNNRLTYATIRNAYQGIVATGPSAGTQLTLEQTIIDNAYDAGLLAVNSSIVANNLLVSNCGNNIMLVNGGNYSFNHCTSVAYSNRYLQHKEPVMLLSNYLSNGNTVTTQPLSALFRNCIFWAENNGTVASEVVLSRQGAGPFSVQFDHVLWRVPADPAGATITGTNIRNSDPLFDSIDVNNRFFNFRLKENSPARNKGTATSLATDLDGRPRAAGLPDLGAYERQ